MKVALLVDDTKGGICPIVTNGASTGWHPIQPSSKRSAKSNQNIPWWIGRKLELRFENTILQVQFQQVRFGSATTCEQAFSGTSPFPITQARGKFREHN